MDENDLVEDINSELERHRKVIKEEEEKHKQKMSVFEKQTIGVFRENANKVRSHNENIDEIKLKIFEKLSGFIKFYNPDSEVEKVIGMFKDSYPVKPLINHVHQHSRAYIPEDKVEQFDEKFKYRLKNFNHHNVVNIVESGNNYIGYTNKLPNKLYICSKSHNKDEFEKQIVRNDTNHIIQNVINMDRISSKKDMIKYLASNKEFSQAMEDTIKDLKSIEENLVEFSDKLNKYYNKELVAHNLTDD